MDNNNFYGNNENDMNTASSQPTGNQPTETQPIGIQPVSEQPVNIQPTDTQPTNVQPVNAQPTNVQPTDTQPINAQSTWQPYNANTASYQQSNVTPNQQVCGSTAQSQTVPQYGNAQYGDFSRYQNASSNFSSIPHETVYINNQPKVTEKKKKLPKGRLGLGAVAAIVAVCMVFSGGAAFAGTYVANRMNGTTVASGSNSTGTPSVVFQSYTNTNKTAGTYEQVAEAVTPTVVAIVTESVSTSSTFWGGSYVVSGAGSGVIISSDGLIITNNHVVEGANTITVTLSDGTEYPAKLIGTDSDSDIAVIQIDAKNLPCALIGDSNALKVGQEVLAVGNPLGEFGGSVTNGIVSGLSRNITIDGTEMSSLIQTNAAVNPGNSGGGLFNLYGELIGIVNAKSSSTDSGTAVEGIGFAIPIADASKVATELVNYGYVRGKVILGITYVDIEDSWTAMYYRVNELGVYVVTSEYTDELKSGDRIVAIDDEQVTYSSDIKSILKKHSVGDEVTIKVVRQNQYRDIKVVLHEYVPETVETDVSTFKEKASGKSAVN